VFVALTAVCVTVITPFNGPASAPSVVLAIVTVAESLSAMVLVATSVAPKVARPELTEVNVTMTVSLVSTIASLMTGIEMVAVVEPEGIVTVPLSAVKSEPDVAVPPTEYAMTVLVALTAVWVTVITPLTGPVSAPSVVLAIVTVAESLSAMVLVATSVAPSVARPELTDVRVTTTVSLPSTIASLITGIEIVAVVEPAGIVTVPLNAVKSEPDVAVPPTE